jgi:hypothetical protein
MISKVSEHLPIFESAVVLVRLRSHRQPDRKRESQRYVIGCKTSRSQRQWRPHSGGRTIADRTAAHRKLERRSEESLSLIAARREMSMVAAYVIVPQTSSTETLGGTSTLPFWQNENSIQLTDVKRNKHGAEQMDREPWKCLISKN